MNESHLLPLIAVDVGNARIKLGLFPAADAAPASPRSAALPEPAATFVCEGRQPEFGRVGPWLDEDRVKHAWWWIATVNRPATTRLLEWLRAHRPADAVTMLSAGDLPLEVRLPRPDMVGVDRLLDAVAANRLREPGRAAVVIDVGTAITVDLVSRDGAFLGGAILPGIAMAARALHEFTDLLPLVEMSELGPPPPVLGDATEAAMRSGLFWGALGAVRELVARLSDEGIGGGGQGAGIRGRGSGVRGRGSGKKSLAASQPPDVFITGGAAPSVAQLLGDRARYVPHLTLAGIRLAAAYAAPSAKTRMCRGRT
jgi:type III pantothenate kinase